MHISSARLFPLLASLLALVPAPPARAVLVDGHLDAAYVLMSTQTTQTSAADDQQGAIGFGTGSELDAAWAAVDGGVLYLFFAGNLKDTVCGTQACTDLDFLMVFLDRQPGGQNTLLGPTPTGHPFAGLTFDAALSPDYVLEYYDAGALDHQFSRHAAYGTLPTGGAGTSYSLGSGTNAGAPGTLSGGTNPFGIEATVDNSNTAGVMAGCAAASGAGVTTGVELAIPLAAIGSPSNCITVCAFVNGTFGSTVTNQVLGAVPPGTCELGAPSGVNFAAIPGTQAFTVCLGATPARRNTWGALKRVYR